jgi:hypothetical protein
VTAAAAEGGKGKGGVRVEGRRVTYLHSAASQASCSTRRYARAAVRTQPEHVVLRHPTRRCSTGSCGQVRHLPSKHGHLCRRVRRPRVAAGQDGRRVRPALRLDFVPDDKAGEAGKSGPPRGVPALHGQEHEILPRVLVAPREAAVLVVRPRAPREARAARRLRPAWRRVHDEGRGGANRCVRCEEDVELGEHGRVEAVEEVVAARLAIRFVQRHRGRPWGALLQACRRRHRTFEAAPKEIVAPKARTQLGSLDCIALHEELVRNTKCVVAHCLIVEALHPEELGQPSASFCKLKLSARERKDRSNGN